MLSLNPGDLRYILLSWLLHMGDDAATEAHFRTGGEAFRITAINPNRPKYPISAERIADGRDYKFSAENVAAYLKSPSG